MITNELPQMMQYYHLYQPLTLLPGSKTQRSHRLIITGFRRNI